MTEPMIAFDFGGSKVEVALAAPGLTVVSRVTLPTEAENGAPQVVERALAAARGLLASYGSESPLSVGVATMGFTREDGVDLAPNVPGWTALRLPATFRAAFPAVPLLIENDVRAAAIAELRCGALMDVSSGLYLNLGTGVAAAVVVGGQLLPGGRGVAGEVGYWVVPTPGGNSTLEDAVGGAGVARRARRIGIEGGFAGLLSSPEPAATALADEVIELIGMSVTNMVLLLDPERVVLGGGYVRAGDRLVDSIRACLSSHRLLGGHPPVEVVIGRYGSEAGLSGAIALAETAAGTGAGTGAGLTGASSEGRRLSPGHS